MLRSTPAIATAALLGFGIACAQASDSQRLAERGGFLLGSAQHCGVASERVVKAGVTIQKLIAAAAADSGDGEQATTRFAEFFLATAAIDSHKKLTPVCKKVIAEFEKLERHHIQAKAE